MYQRNQSTSEKVLDLQVSLKEREGTMDLQVVGDLCDNYNL
jgi:hypothetical protein